MNNNFSRYKCQTLLKEIGIDGQKKISESSVCILGVGATGSVVANNLVRSGVGKIKLIDRDFVELSNLQRQLLYDEKDVEKVAPKSVAAKDKLEKINSNVEIESIILDITAKNIMEQVEGYDLIIDGTDNFQTRFLINDTSIKLNIPWVFTGVVATKGQVMAIIPNKTPCLKCMMPNFKNSKTGTAATEGILGPLVNIMGSMSTILALKILLDMEIPSVMTFYNVWENKFNTLATKLNSNCNVCGRG